MASKFLDSTIAQILEDIISQISFEGESHSNIADILLSILNQTPYEEEPKSVIADLFLKLKAKIEGEPFDPNDKEYLSTIGEILVSILEETEYDREPQSRIAELLLELKAELESFIEITVSGSVVSFNTKVSKPAVNLEADIVAWQEGSGDPYPAGGSAQKWDEEWELGSYSATDGTPSPGSVSIRSKASNPIPVQPNTEYRFIAGNARVSQIYWYEADMTYISRTSNASNPSFVTTSPENAYYCRFQMPSAYGVAYNNDISVNYPSSDTSYHKYSNERPIHGWSASRVTRFGGKNMLDVNSPSIILGYYLDSTGKLVKLQSDSWLISDYILVKVGNTYVASSLASGGSGAYACFYDKDKQFTWSAQINANKDLVFIPKTNDMYVRLCVRRIADEYLTAQLELGTTATSYEPYVTPDIYTIQLGDEIFGGKVNFTTGEMEVAREIVIYKGSSGEQWQVNGTNGYYVGAQIKYQTEQTPILNYFKGLIPGIGSELQNWEARLNAVYRNLLVKPDLTQIPTVTDWVQYLSQHNLIVVLKLATPFTVQLTPEQVQILKGNNTLFADSGNIKLTYLDKT